MTTTTESYAQKALNWINERIAEGKTVYISTMTRTTAVSPKTVKRWEKSGHQLFKVTSSGLCIASGKRFDLITTNTASLCRITAE